MTHSFWYHPPTDQGYGRFSRVPTSGVVVRLNERCGLAKTIRTLLGAKGIATRSKGRYQLLPKFIESDGAKTISTFSVVTSESVFDQTFSDQRSTYSCDRGVVPVTGVSSCVAR